MAIEDSDLTAAANDVTQAAHRAAVRMASNNPDGQPRGRDLDESDYETFQERIMEACLPSNDSTRMVSSALGNAVGDEGLGAGEVAAVSDIASIIGAQKGQWSGATAKDFSKFYIAPFDECRDNQMAAIGELAGSMDTLTAILDSRRQDYVDACSKTVDALDALGNCSMASAAITLSIVGTVVTIGSATLSAGASLPWAVAGAVNSTLTTTVAVSQAVKGMTVKSVLNSMKKVLDEIDTAANHQVEALTEKVGDSNDIARTNAMKDKSGRVPVLLPHEPSPAGDDRGDHTLVTNGDSDLDFNRPS